MVGPRSFKHAVVDGHTGVTILQEKKEEAIFQPVEVLPPKKEDGEDDIGEELAGKLEKSKPEHQMRCIFFISIMLISTPNPMFDDYCAYHVLVQLNFQ